MTSKRKQEYLYWDSNVILAYLQEEPHRIKTLDILMDEIATQKRPGIIITSSLAQTEVAYFKDESILRQLDSDVEDRLLYFWSNYRVIKITEVNSAIAFLARNLIRKSVTFKQDHLKILKPPDAIHLATAQWLKNEGAILYEFFTYDAPLARTATLLYDAGEISFKPCEPYTSATQLPLIT